MKIFGGLLIGSAFGCGSTNCKSRIAVTSNLTIIKKNSVDTIVDGLNEKIQKLEHKFDRSLTPDAILDLTSVDFLPGTTDASRSSGVLEVTIGGPGGIKGTVCDNHINENAANMFCQMLGFIRASNATASLLPQGLLLY